MARRRWPPRPGIKEGAKEALIATDEGGYMSEEVALQCEQLHVAVTPSRANRKRLMVASSSESESDEEDPPLAKQKRMREQDGHVKSSKTGNSDGNKKQLHSSRSSHGNALQ